MASAQIRPDWDVGTITLVAGSTNFTTTNAHLLTAAVEAGDQIMIKGYVLIIASIIDGNSGTLFEACPAPAAGVNMPLRIRFQPVSSRLTAANYDLVRMLSSGNVSAFSELIGEDGKVPYFTGLGTMGLADFDPSANYVVTVNGEIGPDIVLDAAKVGAVPDTKTADIDENTSARHTHANKATLDAITAAFTTALKTKLDGIATGATANATDAFLRNLANATGSLPSSQVSGLDGALSDLAAAVILRATFDQSANWIINPGFTINQRGGVKKPANGVYGFDRWKGHSLGIEQVVEALPAGTYTLAWTGGGTGTFDGGTAAASPIVKTVTAGNKSVRVPQTATWVQLIAGDKATVDVQATPRPLAIEEALCFRYFYRYILPGNLAFPSFVANGTLVMQLKTPVTMRAAPTLTLLQPSVTLYNLKPLSVGYPSKDGCTINLSATVVNEACGYVNTATPTANYVDMAAEL